VAGLGWKGGGPSRGPSLWWKCITFSNIWWISFGLVESGRIETAAIVYARSAQNCLVATRLQTQLEENRTHAWNDSWKRSKQFTFGSDKMVKAQCNYCSWARYFRILWVISKHIWSCAYNFSVPGVFRHITSTLGNIHSFNISEFRTNLAPLSCSCNSTGRLISFLVNIYGSKFQWNIIIKLMKLF